MMTTTHRRYAGEDNRQVLTFDRSCDNIRSMTALRKNREKGSDSYNLDHGMTGNYLLIPIGTVSREVSLSKSSIYRMMATGTFPKPVRIGARAVRWVATDIEKWLKQLQKNQ